MSLSVRSDRPYSKRSPVTARSLPDASPDAYRDPIFAAIEKHCDALVVYHSATNDKVSDRAMDREGKVLGELFKVGAISVPGILALLHHLGSPEFLILDRKEETGDTILSEAIELSDDKGKQIAHALKCMLSVAVQIKLPDVGRSAVDEAGSPR